MTRYIIYSHKYKKYFVKKEYTGSKYNAYFTTMPKRAQQYKTVRQANLELNYLFLNLKTHDFELFDIVKVDVDEEGKVTIIEEN